MYARRWTGESEKKGRKGERRERGIGERRDGRIQWRGDIYIYIYIPRAREEGKYLSRIVRRIENKQGFTQCQRSFVALFRGSLSGTSNVLKRFTTPPLSTRTNCDRVKTIHRVTITGTDEESSLPGIRRALLSHLGGS